MVQTQKIRMKKQYIAMMQVNKEYYSITKA